MLSLHKILCLVTEFNNAVPNNAQVQARVRRARGGRLTCYLPAGALALASTLALSAATLLPPTDARYAVAVFAPGTTAAQIDARLARTPMRIAGLGMFANLALVDLGGQAPGALFAAGAWLVADPDALGGCMTDAGGHTPAGHGVGAGPARARAPLHTPAHTSPAAAGI